MAKITTGNTAILREYYFVRTAADDVAYIAMNFLSQFNDVVGESATITENLATFFYSGGQTIQYKGTLLGSDPSDWSINESIYSAGGVDIHFNGNVVLNPDFRINADQTSVQRLFINDPNQVLLDPQTKPVTGGLDGNFDFYRDENGRLECNVLMTSKYATLPNGLTFRVSGPQVISSTDGTLNELVEEVRLTDGNGNLLLEITGLNFTGTPEQEAALEGGPEAFIDFFLSGDDTVTGTTSDDSYLYAGAGDDVVDGGSGDDLLIGGSGLGNDTYIGGTGTDTVKYTSATAGIRVDLSKGTAASISGDAASIGRDQLSGIENIIGGQYDDILVGDAQANRLEGGSGSDQLDGGSGIDTAAYSGSRLTMSRSGDQWQVAGDTLTNIERVEFDNGAIGLDDISEKAYRIYKAAFDRTPDEEGLGYWIQELDKGFALHQVTNSFVISQEFKNLYGADLNNEGFITALYNNVLDRDPDQGGLDYWINDMENNGMSRADVLASFSESAENIANTDPLIELGVLYQPYDLLG